ncbi:MAG: GntR family transcriptional regulator [Fuerstiella sp.]
MTEITSAERAYQHLRRKLLSGEFPPGSRLLYGPIGKQIGISATPVREAAGQLAKEGLVNLVPQMGAIVRQLDERELREIYEVRLAIEPFSAGLAADRATTKQVESIAAAALRMQALTDKLLKSSADTAGKRISKQFDLADYEFHMAILRATDNRALLRTAEQSHVLARMFSIDRHRYTAESMTATVEEHQQILAAIQEGDSEAAARESEVHIRHGLTMSMGA